jgi:hypothetical protein
MKKKRGKLLRLLHSDINLPAQSAVKFYGVIAVLIVGAIVLLIQSPIAGLSFAGVVVVGFLWQSSFENEMNHRPLQTYCADRRLFVQEGLYVQTPQGDDAAVSRTHDETERILKALKVEADWWPPLEPSCDAV